MLFNRSILTTVLTSVAAGVLIAGCAGQPVKPVQPAGTGQATASAPTESKTLTVITHDSFTLDDATIGKFRTESGYDVKFVAPGDAGTVVNQLILTKDAPLGDVVFGVDNTFAGRAIEAGVLAPYAASALPPAAAKLAADDKPSLTPIDYGDVCLNADSAWFKANSLAVPETLDDLLKPEYKDLLVVSNPASSSPGLAFLAATVGAKGEGYLDYWKALKANGLKVVKGWTEAYTVEFSGSSGKGDRPLVLSYASSPAYEPATVALTQTCFRQVEYAGVLEGAENPAGAQAVVEWMLSDEFQAALPENMYVYPVSTSVEVPAEWAQYAPLADEPLTLDPAEIDANRDQWIEAWTATVLD